jgi:hypothetical protein
MVQANAQPILIPLGRATTDVIQCKVGDAIASRYETVICVETRHMKAVLKAVLKAQITGKPASARALKSHCDSGPASNPIRLKWRFADSSVGPPKAAMIKQITVDRVEENRIKVTKADSGEGRHKGHHHYIDGSLVAYVEGNKVRLSANGDVAVTMEQET